MGRERLALSVFCTDLWVLSEQNGEYLTFVFRNHRFLCEFEFGGALKLQLSRKKLVLLS